MVPYEAQINHSVFYRIGFVFLKLQLCLKRYHKSMALVPGSNKDTSLLLVDASHFYGTFLASVYIYETSLAPACISIDHLSYCFHSLTYISATTQILVTRG